MSAGIIIARFQLYELHKGHIELINYALNNYNKIGFILGSRHNPGSENIIPFEIRKQMITELFKAHSHKIFFIDEQYDVDSNELWSKNIDECIEKHLQNNSNIGRIELIGSRDSFISSYSGKFNTKYVVPTLNSTATELREQIIPETYCSKEWSKGAIWGAKQIEDVNHENIILKTDSYKLTHWGMYGDLKYVHSYFESRKGAQFPYTIFFGLQQLLYKLSNSIVTAKDVVEANAFTLAHFGIPELLNSKMWNHIVNNCNGKLPVIIKAVPEGTKVPIGNVMMTIENTDPECASLTNHLETMLTHVWYPSTVATLARTIKEIFLKYLSETSEDSLGVDFMLHDFGFRGVSSCESAGTGSMGHLTSFKGTDTIEGIQYVRKYYGGHTTCATLPQQGADMPAFSVVASEHSVMCQGGRDGEYNVVERLIDLYPSGILSLVLDSYDIYKAVEHIGTVLKDKVLQRDGKLVIRPDSGDPLTVTIKIFEILEKTFGVTENSKGYKVLHPKVGLIYGDGLDIEAIMNILETMKEHKWAASNIVFGMGGGLLQKVNRDTQRNAFKCSANSSDGITWNDIHKDPIDGSKTSKKGKLKLIKLNGEYKTVKIDEYPECENQLVTVFENGKITRHLNFEEVRSNLST